MKAVLDHKGTLAVIAETELEAYALRKWGEDHFNGVAGQALLIVEHAPPAKEPTP